MLIYVFIFIIMLFLHVYDDYSQGILADLKQKKWWEENYPQEKYKYDYIVALIAHSFKWTFMILLPPTVYVYIIGINFNFYLGIYILMFILNCIFHAMVDDLKANKFVLNLWQDQSMHILQIFLTCMVILPSIYALSK